MSGTRIKSAVRPIGTFPHESVGTEFNSGQAQERPKHGALSNDE